MPTGSNVFAGALESINSDSRISAVTGWFGTRPFLTLDLAMSSLEHKYGLRLEELGMHDSLWRSSFMAGLRNSKAHAERVLEGLVFGAHESYGNLASIRKGLLSLMGLKLLPFVSVTAGFGDLITSSAHFFKMSRKNPFLTSLELIGERVKKLGAEDRRQVARMSNQILTSDIEAYTRRVYNSDAAGVGSWIENTLMKTTGLPMITDIGMTSNATYMAVQMGATYKLPWEQLTPEFRNHIRTYGIEPDIWETVRGLGEELWSTVDGVDHAYIDYLDIALRNAAAKGQFSTEMAQSWFQKFSVFYHDIQTDKSIPVQGLYENAFFHVDNKNPDSIIHNVARLVSQFKAIAVTAFRSVVDAGAGKTLGRKRDLFHANFGKVLALSTFYGGATILLGDIVRGRGLTRDGEDLISASFLAEAALRGGTFGILGDFFLGEHNNYFSGWAGSVLGPAATPAYYSSQILRHLLLLDKDELPDDVAQLVESLTPAITPLHPILLNTVFADTLSNIGE